MFNLKTALRLELDNLISATHIMKKCMLGEGVFNVDSGNRRIDWNRRDGQLEAPICLGSALLALKCMHKVRVLLSLTIISLSSGRHRLTRFALWRISRSDSSVCTELGLWVPVLFRNQHVLS